LKSLAHPDWPYAGTAHEWRGFVKDEARPWKNDPLAELADALIATGNQMRDNVYYQKQNFGPELK
jgi:hypothetical protein